VLARGTPGFTGAELANLVSMAAIQAAVENRDSVSMKNFEYAKDKIIMGACVAREGEREKERCCLT
jgi:ATP-dependent Zn protease